MKLRILTALIVFLAALGQFALPQQAAKPLTKDQIMTVVTAGMDNAELAKQIEARGIDFDLTDDYLQALTKAGAQEVVIRALRTVKPSPLGRDQLLLLVAGGVPSERAAALVKQRGVDFMPDEKYLESLRTGGRGRCADRCGARGHLVRKGPEGDAQLLILGCRFDS